MKSTKTRRTQLEVLQDQLEPHGYHITGSTGDYKLWHRDTPDDIENFEIIAEARKRVNQIINHPINDTEFSIHVNEIGVRYKPKKIDGVCDQQITAPDDAVAFLKNIFPPDTLRLKEQFYVVLMNNAKRVVGYYHLSTGGATATIVDPAEVLRIAILTEASFILLAHNHPSGQTTESKADLKLTERIVKAGKLLGIKVSDHIILTADDYLSFRQKDL